MPIEIDPQSKAVDDIAGANPGEFMLFLGAGASISSGVPSAGEMMKIWREKLYRHAGEPGPDLEGWCALQDWHGKDEEYSVLFEKAFPHARARQRFVEPFMEAGFPSWGYLYLANAVRAGKFNIILTTNFDDLINDALSMFLDYNPVICSVDSQMETVNVVTSRAKIIKLHGDYLFKKLRNTVDELQRLDAIMDAKFREFGKQCGMVVVGYAGRDRSVMRVINAVMEDPESFPSGIWWGVRSAGDLHPNVRSLAEGYPQRFRVFECLDFDGFMASLQAVWDFPLPASVLKPFDRIRERFARLTKSDTSSGPPSGRLARDIKDLEAQLGRLWNKESNRSALDLLQAQLALGRRDYKQTLETVARLVEEAVPDVETLTVWGDALAIKCDEELDDASGKLALEKWREAIRLDPATLTARYSLMRHGARHHLIDEAVRVAEELRQRVPGDLSLRRNLAQLLMQQGRPGEALTVVEALLATEPDAADLHAMRCAACEQRGLIAEGLAAIGRAVELEPSNPWFRFSHANGLARAGELQRAGEEYERTVSLAPSNLGFRLQIAMYYAQRQLSAEALRHLEEARRIEPGSAEVRGWLAELYLGRGRIPDARREVEEAFRLTPGDARILINRGIITLSEGALADAEDSLKRALAANSQAPQAHYWMSLLMWIGNRLGEAQQYRNSLAFLNPQAAAQLDWMVQSMMAQTQGDPHFRLQAWQNQMAQAAGMGGAAFPAAGPSGPPPLPR